MPVVAPDSADRPVLRARGIGIQRSGDRRGVLRRRGPHERTVHGLDLDVERGTVTWLVGEWGSALLVAAVLAGVEEPTEGSLELSGKDVTRPGRKERALGAARVSCLLPEALPVLGEKRTARAEVADAGRTAGASKEPGATAAGALLLASGLPEDRHDLPIRELGDVERWAVRIARLAAQRPRVVVRVADDPQVPAELRGVLGEVVADLRAQHGTAEVLVADRLPASLLPTERAVVLCGGQVVEILGPGDLDHPLHPYARTLRSRPHALAPTGGVEVSEPAAQVAGPRVDVAPIEVGDRGCPYRASCPRAKSRCAEMPALARPLGATHVVACHYPEDPRRPSAGDGSIPGRPGDAESGEPTAHEFAQG